MGKIIDRIYDERIKKSLDGNLILVVLGPRQTGKTTSVKRLLEHIPENRKLTLNFDSSRTREKVLQDEGYIVKEIESVIRAPLEECPDKFYLFIDEAQKLPASFEIIKILYDEYNPKLKIILTGSSSLEMLDRSAESLSGRIQSFHIYPFSISEVCLYKQIPDFSISVDFYKKIFDVSLNEEYVNVLIKKKRPYSKDVTQTINSLLTTTSFPPAYSRIPTAAVDNWLIDYIDTYIEKDMRSLSELKNIEGYRNVVKQLALRAGRLLSYREISNEVGLSHATVKKYLSIWQESLSGFKIQPFFINPLTRIRKSPKIYFIDNGLIWAFEDFASEEILKASGRLGFMLENLIVCDFFKYASLQEKKPTFYFWEKSSVSEVDIVISTKGYIIPVEIKSSNIWDDKFCRGIKAFFSKHKKLNINIPFGIIFYNGDYPYFYRDYSDDKSQAIPIYCLPLWLL